MLDVSPLVSEARPIAEKVARVYLKHTRPWFVALMAHGSAVKGGFIPGCSDIDFKLFLDEAAFSEDGRLLLGTAMDIQRDLSKIDPSPFQYIQCDAVPVGGEGTRADFIVIPGTYHMLSGELPVAEATPEQVLRQAREMLPRLFTEPLRAIDDLLEHGGGRLEYRVRLLCTAVWPALFNALTLRADDPLSVWRLPKPAAIELVPESEPLGREIRAFYRHVREYYAHDHSVESALNVIESGVGCLRAAR
ncbi:MAG: hypothetical protein L0177_06965, partial [Chloroflexi bacterium]|nr:hypothetical protein [Chloroflexota bacterium]